MRRLADIFLDNAILINGRHTNGTDKQTNHAYGDAYDSIFTDRLSVTLMMEIGVADGSSLLAWREAFPNATVVGMDIHPADKARGDRLEFHLGDQCNQADCDRAAAGRLFDVIVEDATHQLADTMLTLMYMWQYVRPGGLYIIEEFANIGALRATVKSLLKAELVDTVSPFGGIEPLVVIRKTNA